MFSCTIVLLVIGPLPSLVTAAATTTITTESTSYTVFPSSSLAPTTSTQSTDFPFFAMPGRFPVIPILPASDDTTTAEPEVTTTEDEPMSTTADFSSSSSSPGPSSTDYLSSSSSSWSWPSTNPWPSTLSTRFPFFGMPGRFPVIPIFPASDDTTTAEPEVTTTEEEPMSTTAEEEPYQSAEVGFNGVTDLSLMTVGGIVVGCAALVSITVIVVAMKAFGGGGTAVAGVGTATSGSNGQWAKPQKPPAYRDHGVEYGQSQQKQGESSNKYGGGHVVDFY